MAGEMKSLNEIRDAECDKFGYAMEKKYNQIELANMPSIIMDEAFKAGFDCRDKLGNEALKVAVEALEFIKKLHEDDIILTSTEYNHKSGIAYRKTIDALRKWNFK
jgi:predicted nucleotide-binding protein (sugar kinase/HSP70/actin superfamily)